VLSYHWESLAERADSLRNVGVLPPASVGIAFVDRLPCESRSGQQGQDEKGEEFGWETHFGLKSPLQEGWFELGGKGKTERLQCFTRIWPLLGSWCLGVGFAIVRCQRNGVAEDECRCWWDWDVVDIVVEF
jgi:hypothetical protein